MGNLHDGHISLINLAKKTTDLVIVSLFVNPIQFSSFDDYSTYPKTYKKDISILNKNGVDILLCPDRSEIFPYDFNTSVIAKDFTEVLEGKCRTGHMEGVATIVTKLLNIVKPDIAIFGEKDFQQLMLIKSICKDLNISIDIISSKIIRDTDGLALSSRNNLLSRDEKKQANEIFKSLKLGYEKALSGENNVSNIINLVKSKLSKYNLIKVEYISIRNPNNFQELKIIDDDFIILIAAYVDSIRLIDNIKYIQKEKC